ncbi:MAG: alpha/beta fold hydrolase [Alphaproteobacteria bacterium]|nr:alpha/beta fold hydrolase [Alphaproteobacteria bacterium]
MKITRHFVRVGEREVHYRCAGSGPPFVLFHVSPQSSSFVLPELLSLADRYTLVALDTPGYGDSDPLPLPAPNMADYADAVIETLEALGIDRAPLYGSHTGANIAVEVARRAPQRVAALVLDGLSLSTPEVAHDRINHYAPRFEPTADGGHLAWAWQHTRDQLLFWPWYQPHKANRLHADVKNAGYLHDVVLGKMAAADYWLGYRAAFGHDSRDALKQVTIDTFFVTADADAHTAIERSLPDLPDNIRFVDTTADTQLDAIRTVLSSVEHSGVFQPPEEPEHRPGLYRSMIKVGDGQRLVQRGGPNQGQPLVLLHGGMGTSASIADRAAAFAASRPVFSLDIAGTGDSDPLSQANASIDAFADDVCAVLVACGVDTFDLYGESGGATLAAAVAGKTSNQVGKLILDRPEFPDDEHKDGLISNIAPAIEATWDGTHFLTAWHMLRDAALFWPWYNRTRDNVRDIEPDIEPAALQARLVAWLKGRLTYGDYMRSTLSADLGSLLQSVSQPVLVFGTAGDQLESHAHKTANALNTAELHITDQLRAPTSAMAAFLSA